MADDEDSLTTDEYPLEADAFGDLARELQEDLGDDEDEDKEPASVQIRNLRMRVGTTPVAYNVSSLYQRAHAHAPDLAIFDSFDVWLVVSKVGAIQCDGPLDVRAIHYEVKTDPNQARVIDLFPKTEFGRPEGPSLTYSADLSANGTLEAPSSAVESATSGLALAGGVTLRTSATVGIVGELLFRALRARVTALGECSPHAEWRVERLDEPVVGDQTLIQTMLVPLNTQEIKLRVRGALHTKLPVLGIGDMRRTKWLDVRCNLIGEA